MQQAILNLREKLKQSIQRNSAKNILFSGGLDTSIIASQKPSSSTVTVNLASYGEDVYFSEIMAKKFKLKHFRREVEIDEAIDAIPEVIKILKSFDLAIPNDVVVFFGLKLAKEMGIEEIMTGDGADELFAGYTFMQGMRDLDKYLIKMTQFMTFNSNVLGNFYNIRINQPFIYEEIKQLALDVPLEFKIREENGQMRGKWILRKAFESDLGKEIAWQSKRPLEYGSGMTKLREIITSKISDKEFAQKSKAYPVKFINKEHLYYYEIYRKEFGGVPAPKGLEKICPRCLTGMRETAFHCKVCGGVMEWKK